LRKASCDSVVDGGVWPWFAPRAKEGIMATEREWARSLQERLDIELRSCDTEGWAVRVDAGDRLAYAHEILRYDKGGPADVHTPGYQTDLLAYDIRDTGDWIPRVVVECKQGITTHDALTYSTKACTHKQVHPYLRYGLLIAGYETALPGRVIRHGAYFDFMMVWSSQEPTQEEWADLIEVLSGEVGSSRTLQALLTESRLQERERFRLLHRPLRLK
jgi:hypothetical protein